MYIIVADIVRIAATTVSGETMTASSMSSQKLAFTRTSALNGLCGIGNGIEVF